MPEPKIMADRSRQLVNLEELNARKSSLEVRLVNLRHEVAEVEMEIRVAELGIEDLLGLLYAGSLRGRSLPAPSPSPPAAAPSISPPVSPIPRPTAPPPSEPEPITPDDRNSNRFPLAPALAEYAAMRSVAPEPKIVEAPPGSSAMAVGAAGVADALSTRAQVRRAHAIELAARCLTKLGGAATLAEVVLEFRKEEPDCTSRRLQELLERSSCFIRDDDGRFHSVEGADFRTKGERRIRERRLLVAQAIQDLGGTARWVDLLDLLPSGRPRSGWGSDHGASWTPA